MIVATCNSFLSVCLFCVCFFIVFMPFVPSCLFMQTGSKCVFKTDESISRFCNAGFLT
jgi:hypothetical protein